MKRRSRVVQDDSTERQALAKEEMAEAIQVLCKVERHGWNSSHPAGGPANYDLVATELGDVLAAIKILAESGDVSWQDIEDACEAKLEKVQRWMHRPKNKAIARTLRWRMAEARRGA